jgi:hypothetical protein
MKGDVRTCIVALQAAVEDPRINMEHDCSHDSGYLAGLERAADIVAAKAHGLKTGAEA